MEKLKFYKETNGRWYVDLPEWPGSKSDLEMVYGADTMLDYISEGEFDITLYVSEKEFENSNKLEYIRMADEMENGAFYKINKYNGIDFEQEIWLCDVLKFVFDGFPELLFFSKQT